MTDRIHKMASGNLALDLGDQIDWQMFPQFAEALAERLGWEIVERVSAATEHVWTVHIDGLAYWLSWDDWTLACLESQSDEASARIPVIAKAVESAWKPEAP